MRRAILSVFFLMSVAVLAVGQQYDLVIEGGRAVDPETGLDGVRNVGIRDGRIAHVAMARLEWRRHGGERDRQHP